MTTKPWWLATGLLAMLGCTETAQVPSTENTKPVGTTPAVPDPAPKPAPADDKDKDKKAASADALTPEELATLKKLPEGDREAAIAQKVCPISGDHLGTEAMGEPIKVTADGKTAFLCCKGCKADFEKDPSAALAKLGK